MASAERVYSVLMVSASSAFNASFAALLPESRFSPLRTVGDISSAKRLASEYSYDIVVINSPLPDDSGLSFAIELSESKTTVALLLVRSELYPAVYARASASGVYMLPKPIPRQVALQAIDWLITTSERLVGLSKKTVSMEERMQEIRLVNRAKWLLIERRGMTEPEAHRYIEKQAMDRCAPKRVIARELLELWGEGEDQG